jgi:hypothetical protein
MLGSVFRTFEGGVRNYRYPVSSMPSTAGAVELLMSGSQTPID